MKISRRDFLKTTAVTSLYFAGFGAVGHANSATKKNLVIIITIIFLKNLFWTENLF